jgi:hypothetical protein
MVTLSSHAPMGPWGSSYTRIFDHLVDLPPKPPNAPPPGPKTKFGHLPGPPSAPRVVHSTHTVPPWSSPNIERVRGVGRLQKMHCDSNPPPKRPKSASVRRGKHEITTRTAQLHYRFFLAHPPIPPPALPAWNKLGSTTGRLHLALTKKRGGLPRPKNTLSRPHGTAVEYTCWGRVQNHHTVHADLAHHRTPHFEKISP